MGQDNFLARLLGVPERMPAETDNPMTVVDSLLWGMLSLGDRYTVSEDIKKLREKGKPASIASSVERLANQPGAYMEGRGEDIRIARDGADMTRARPGAKSIPLHLFDERRARRKER